VSANDDIDKRQKDIHINHNKLRKYLILWEDWAVCDSTWFVRIRIKLNHREPAEHIPFLEHHYAAFDLAAVKEGKDARVGEVVLLDEALKVWDDTGRLKGQRSGRYVKMGWPLLVE